MATSRAPSDMKIVIPLAFLYLCDTASNTAPCFKYCSDDDQLLLTNEKLFWENVIKFQSIVFRDFCVA